MRDLRAASHLTLANVLKRLRFEREEDVVAVFLIGSRLWGSASFDSDYDFIIVHRCAKMPPHATLHSGEIDASALHVDEFAKRVHEHEFYELLCLWLPADYRWMDAPLALPSSSSSSVSSSKSKSKPKSTSSTMPKKTTTTTATTTSATSTSFVESVRKRFVLDPARLYASIDEETERDRRVAQKFMEKGPGGLERGRKTLVHALRLLVLAIQLARDGAMHDLRAAQPFHDEIVGSGGSGRGSGGVVESWAQCSARYRPVFDDLRRQLRELCASAATAKGRRQMTAVAATAARTHATADEEEKEDKDGGEEEEEADEPRTKEVEVEAEVVVEEKAGEKQRRGRKVDAPARGKQSRGRGRGQKEPSSSQEEAQSRGGKGRRKPAQ